MSLQACYQAHRVWVHRLCLRYGGGSAGWAEDVTQDVFVKLLEHLPRLEGTGDLTGWLYRVTTHLALKRLRKDRTFAAKVARMLTGAPPPSEPSPDELFEGKESARAAVKAMEALPPKERVVMSMKLVDGKSQNEIAEALGFSKGYVSKLVTRAEEQLKRAGWEVSDVGA
ncbi:MAG TPA: sigma-70 family RNA polymerase sigma factor [Myxococcaceae bacterium]|nr:sigma-70 family RNA polymerase sigma factor [Myxococcaceae bacterium]